MTKFMIWFCKSTKKLEGGFIKFENWYIFNHVLKSSMLKKTSRAVKKIEFGKSKNEYLAKCFLALLAKGFVLKKQFYLKCKLCHQQFLIRAFLPYITHWGRPSVTSQFDFFSPISQLEIICQFPKILKNIYILYIKNN